MEAATWDNCREDFVFDGTLIELRVPGTGDAEWEAFWAALRIGPFHLRAFRDGEPIPLPESAAWVFAEREVASVMVSVQSGTVTANCHFFGGDLELDIAPREVTSAAEFESVLVIMRVVAAVVLRDVFAVAEGSALEDAFLRVSPGGLVELLPSCGCT